MKYEPYEYQSYASRFILEHPYCGLILDMGLGKTVITLTALFALALDYFTAGKILVIAPKRVAEDTWPKEIDFRYGTWKDSNHTYGIICIGIGLFYGGENSCHST